MSYALDLKEILFLVVFPYTPYPFKARCVFLAMKYGNLLFVSMALLTLFTATSMTSAYGMYSSTVYEQQVQYANEECCIAGEQRSLFIEKRSPDVIYHQQDTEKTFSFRSAQEPRVLDIFGCVGCADTTIYRTIHLTAPRPEVKYSFFERICPW